MHKSFYDWVCDFDLRLISMANDHRGPSCPSLLVFTDEGFDDPTAPINDGVGAGLQQEFDEKR